MKWNLILSHFSQDLNEEKQRLDVSFCQISTGFSKTLKTNLTQTQPKVNPTQVELK